MGAKSSPGPQNGLLKRNQEAEGWAGWRAAEKPDLTGAFGLGSTKVVGDSGEGSVVGERSRSQTGLTYGRTRDNTEDINYSEKYGNGKAIGRYLGLGKGATSRLGSYSEPGRATRWACRSNSIPLLQLPSLDGWKCRWGSLEHPRLHLFCLSCQAIRLTPCPLSFSLGVMD